IALDVIRADKLTGTIALERPRRAARDLRVNDVGRRGFGRDPSFPTDVEHLAEPAHAHAGVSADCRLERDRDLRRFVDLKTSRHRYLPIAPSAIHRPRSDREIAMPRRLQVYETPEIT